jgi:hypothetical protein
MKNNTIGIRLRHPYSPLSVPRPFPKTFRPSLLNCVVPRVVQPTLSGIVACLGRPSLA